ncbi:MAG: metallophosphoesterase [Actinomycetota bacterium]
MRSPLAPSRLQVWAVEDNSAQLTWGHLPAGEITAWTGDVRVTVEHRGGPGTLTIGGLRPGTRHRIDVGWHGGRTQVVATTLTPPPGELLCRFATVSDLHLGATRWGALHQMRDRSGLETPFAVRCARAAIADAVDWGAELLVVKGDAAHHQYQPHFDLVADLLDEFDDLPMLLIPGNHDVDGRPGDPLPAKVGRRGLPFLRRPDCTDLPGIRIIVADTTVPGRGVGSLAQVGDDILELAARTRQPVFLGIHHQLERHRIPDHYPLGIPAPSSNDFLSELVRINARSLVSSGHTHRNRSRRHDSLAVTEVASTRDWPGVWAGYAVYEGGIRQVVRRVSGHDAVGWHEYSRRALLGLWAWWSSGPLDQRCFSHTWPDSGSRR